ARMAQERVSVLEDPDYGRMSLSTLKRIASALDVAVVVQLVPFSQLADWAANISPETLAVPDFEHDPGFIQSLALSPLAATPTVNVTLPQPNTSAAPVRVPVLTSLLRYITPSR